MGDSGTKLSTTAYFALLSTDTGFKDFEADGLLGMAFSPISDGNPTFIQSLKAYRIITEEMLSMYLNYIGDHEGYGSPASNLEIGSYNFSKYSTSSTYTASIPLSSQAGYWQATAPTMMVGTLGFSNMEVIFDSGTSLILPDSVSYSSIINYLTGLYKCKQVSEDNAQMLVCTCKSVTDMPAFSITIGGTVFVVP